MKYALVLFLLHLISLNIFSQLNPSPTMPSANAISIGQYGELPVSYFTGVPGISIPLYELKGNKIGLPISLNYHAGGLRPEVHPGWVGNGWSLSAGGVITRKLNSMPDELQYIFENGGRTDLQMSDWSSDEKIKTNALYHSLHTWDLQPDEFDFNFLGYSGKFFLDQNGNWQTQCDKRIKVIFDKSIDLVDPFIKNLTGFNLTPGNIWKTFGRFTLIDETGNKYIFGSIDANNTAIEFSDHMLEVPADGARGVSFRSTSWYLSKIISADGTETIDLSYERGPFTSNISYNVFESYSSSFVEPIWPFESWACTDIQPMRGGRNGMVVSPVYLTYISMPSRAIKIDFTSKTISNELTYRREGNTPGGVFNIYFETFWDTHGGTFEEVTSLTRTLNLFPTWYTSITSPSIIPFFNPIHTYGPNFVMPENTWDRFIWLKLNNIYVTNTNTNQQTKAINLTYIESPDKRLQLNSVGWDYNGLIYQQKYTFTYNQTALPEYTKIFTDHWGFYNNNTQLPFHGNWYNIAADPTVRNPDNTGVLTQAEILTEITYPTGGKSHFEYEPNTYTLAVNRNLGLTATSEIGIAGGVRIKQITNTDNFGVAQTKKYYYVNGYNGLNNPSTLPSSGVIDSKPIYHFMSNGQAAHGYGSSNNVSGAYSFYSNNSVVPLTSNSMSNHIGYSTVVEQRPDGSYTVYQFSNHTDVVNGIYNDQPPVNSYNDGFLSGYKSYKSNYYKRGRLLRKTDYFANSTNIATDLKNIYGSPLSEINVNSVNSTTASICFRNGVDDIIIAVNTANTFNCSPFLPITTTSTIYSDDNNGNNAINSINAVYDQYHNIVEQNRINVKGETEITRYKYAYLFKDLGGTNVYSKMMAKNMTDKVIEEQKILVKDNMEYLLSAVVYTYLAKTADLIVNDRIFKLETNAPIPGNNVTATIYGTSDLVLDPKFKLINTIDYDGAGNTIMITDNIGNQKSSLIWGYNFLSYGQKNDQYIIAKITNASSSSIAYASFEDNQPVKWSYQGASSSILSDATMFPPMGNRFLQLNGSISSIALPVSKDYIFSYWAKSGTTVSVNSGITVLESKTGNTINGWTYYEKKLTIPSSGSVGFAVNGYIDELRLYPVDALMTTYAYDANGNMISQCDINNNTTFYKYDDLNRLIQIRDKERNILKTYDYKYKQTTP